MKKIIAALGCFAVGSFAQLIMAIVYLFGEPEKTTELCVMSVLLLVSALGLVVLEQFLKNAETTEKLPDNFRMLLYHFGRLETILVTVQTVNVLRIGVSFLFAVPFWLQAALLVSMVLVMIAAVLIVFILLKDEPEKGQDEKKTETSDIAET